MKTLDPNCKNSSEPPVKFEKLDREPGIFVSNSTPPELNAEEDIKAKTSKKDENSSSERRDISKKRKLETSGYTENEPIKKRKREFSSEWIVPEDN